MTTITNNNYFLHSDLNKNQKNRINSVLKDFNHNFDNTVTDSFAFYKVINSDIVKNDILNHLSVESNIELYLPALNKLVISEVNKIYSKYNRVVKDNDTYKMYLRTALDKISC